MIAGRFATPPMTPTSGSSISSTPSPLFTFPPVEAAALALAGAASDGTVSEEGEDENFATKSMSRENLELVVWESIIGGLAPRAPVYMVGDAVTLEWGTADGAGRHTPAVVAAVGPGGLTLKYESAVSETQAGVAVIEVPIIQALPEPATRRSSWRTKPPCRRKPVPKKARVVAKCRSAPGTPLKTAPPPTKSQEADSPHRKEGFGCSKCAFPPHFTPHPISTLNPSRHVAVIPAF